MAWRFVVKQLWAEPAKDKRLVAFSRREQVKKDDNSVARMRYIHQHLYFPKKDPELRLPSLSLSLLWVLA